METSERNRACQESTRLGNQLTGRGARIGDGMAKAKLLETQSLVLNPQGIHTLVDMYAESVYESQA